MNKKRETKSKISSKVERKQQMILIVSIFLVVIVVAWATSLSWTLSGNSKKEDGKGSVKNMVGEIERSVDNFNANISGKKVDLGNVVESLRKRFNKEKAVVDSMMNKLTEVEMDSWSEYQDGVIYFKYPAEWLVDQRENVIILRDNNINVLTFTIYKGVGDLPDNINGLELIAWLDEQVDRELGVFSSYELTDLSTTHDMYRVSRKDDSQAVDVYWQGDLAVYHIDYISDEQIDRIVKLIISTIK